MCIVRVDGTVGALNGALLERYKPTIVGHGGQGMPCNVVGKDKRRACGYFCRLHVFHMRERTI